MKPFNRSFASLDKGLNEGVEAANTENTSQSDGNNVLNDVTDDQTSDSAADVPAAPSEADERGTIHSPK